VAGKPFDTGKLKMKFKGPKSKAQDGETTLSRGPVNYPASDSEPWVLKEGGPEDNKSPHVFDLEERTAVFGQAIVRLCKKLPRDPTNDVITGARTLVLEG
jgi:hypothetical protein